jgi:hypothetical protein
VLADYFGLVPRLTRDELPPDDLMDSTDPPRPGETDVSGSVVEADRAEAGLLADLVWLQLTDRERLMVAYIDDPLAETANRLGFSKSAAFKLSTRVKHVLAVALGLAGPDADGRRVAAAGALDLTLPEAAAVYQQLSLIAAEHAQQMRTTEEES